MGLLIGEVVSDAAVLKPHGVAATLAGRSITFAELDAEANRVAHALTAKGIERGSLLAWWTAGTTASLPALLACARLGAVFAPLPPTAEATEMAAILDYLEPRLLVVDGPRADGAADFDVATLTVHTGRPDDLGVLAQVASAAPVRAGVAETDPHILYLTSGTTGAPKGVLVSHRATWLRSSAGGGTFGGAVRGERGVLSSFPLHHYGGWHYVIEAWLHRTAIHLVPRADAESLHAAVARHRPSAMYCIPAVWERVLAAPGDLSCLAHADTGTSRVSPGLVERIRARAPHATTTVLYGSSEAGPMAALRDWELAGHPGTVGRPISPGVITIAEDGEILFRGPTVMNGYLGLPDATGKALAGGWYHSGDLGVYDGDGYLTITGRKREIIRSGGETIAPVEVEEAIRALPGIEDVAVVGLPDERWGEIVCAVVVPSPGATAPDTAALRARLGSLPRHKHPRRVRTAASIPRTGATGQIRRAQIRDDLLAADDEAGLWPNSGS
ncbi:class I adenylate-forming enzyme family protein [Amycolatopsis taiwanensis]|uniref:Acyl-CoA synthetase n=1 Tax=Amycolatopsis taiwanensis TaxID=342230 RepID=A0A9W6VFG3_9PSEU|nr:class I adenylate-forming enzyme family protein [Amycolatopsis taiwanensis]GLY65467.1 acyl-CoA synthetase [Amycolatopsis taiwanensis]